MILLATVNSISYNKFLISYYYIARKYSKEFIRFPMHCVLTDWNHSLPIKILNCFRFYKRKYQVFKKMNEDQLQYRTIMTS